MTKNEIVRKLDEPATQFLCLVHNENPQALEYIKIIGQLFTYSGKFLEVLRENHE